MSARIQVIGDEVWADGYRVATLVTDGVPATVRLAFRDAMRLPGIGTTYAATKPTPRASR